MFFRRIIWQVMIWLGVFIILLRSLNLSGDAFDLVRIYAGSGPPCVSGRGRLAVKTDLRYKARCITQGLALASLFKWVTNGRHSNALPLYIASV